jgi:hypothetical protein
VDRETRNMIATATLHVLIDDNFAFFISSPFNFIAVTLLAPTNRRFI